MQGTMNIKFIWVLHFFTVIQRLVKISVLPICSWKLGQSYKHSHGFLIFSPVSTSAREGYIIQSIKGLGI